MGMNGLLCALSDARRQQLEGDPALLQEIIEARQEMPIPGFLDLEDAWHALDVLLAQSSKGTDSVLTDAILGRSGSKFGAEVGFGKPRLLRKERVQAISAALEGLPDDFVFAHYDRLYGKEVHGNYGQERSAKDDVRYLQEQVKKQRDKEIAELSLKLKKVVALYQEASQKGSAILLMIVLAGVATAV